MPILIRGMDLNSIITNVVFKLTDYIYGQIQELRKRPYETFLMKILNQFNKVSKTNRKKI